jgi:hypothetical protein
MSDFPNQKKFLYDLDIAADNFIDNSKQKYEKIISISHNDADGISSLQLIQSLLYKLKLKNDYFIYNRSTSWANYLKGILSKVQESNTALIFTDVGSNLSELIPIITKRQEDFYILDHHEVENGDFQKMPENLYFVNPTIYGYDGLDHIAGATLTYMFAKKIHPSIIKQGWLTIIGIVGDSLRSMDKLKSFNKEIYEEILNEELIENKTGLILFGSMYDSVLNALKYSILPFITGISGENDQKIKDFLKNIQISPNKRYIDIDPDETNNLLNKINAQIGNYAMLPQKQGILRFAFEHALLLNILAFKNISTAISMIQQKFVTRYAKDLYLEYLSNLVKNLKILTEKVPQLETQKAIFIDAGNGTIPPSNWSDTASFSTVNELFDPHKMIFLGGIEQKTQMIKLSIRCTWSYLEDHQNMGVNQVISRIKERYGGMGGGHKLAGGLRLSSASYQRLKENIDQILS